MDSHIKSPESRDWITRATIKFFRYRTLIRRRWWILLLTISVGLAYEGWKLMNRPERYESTGKLMVGGQIAIPDSQQYKEDTDYYYGTQIELLQNPEVHEMARRRVAVESPELSGEVSIEADLIPRTSVFKIVGTGGNPLYTQRFVEAIMESFIQFKNEQRYQTSSTQMVQITEQLSKLADEQKKSEQELKAFVEKNNMAFWEEQGRTSASFLADLKAQQAALTTELNKLQTLGADALLSGPGGTSVPVRAAQPVGDDGDAISPGIPTASGSAVQYASLKQQLVAKQAELAERSRVWRPSHPGIMMIKDEIEGIERMISTVQDLTKESVESRIAAIKSELLALEEDISSWQQKVLEASRLNAEYERLKSQVVRVDSRYEKLLESINQIDVSQEITRDPLMISQHASDATRVAPQAVKNLAVGGTLGLIVGLGLLFLLDRSDDRISSSTEMIESFSEPILGQIPDVGSSRTEAGLPLLGPEDQRYTYAESFRSLRSSLVFMPNQGELKTLIITSAIPGEGKSTIASNLSITMALAGARVLLVDADLRRGDIATLFDVDGRFGLSNVLRGEVPWKSAVQSTRHQTLSVIPRGPVTNQSGELVLVPLLEQLLTDFKNSYDLTVFNTSPILATDDTPTLAPNFDGTLMVMRAAFTSARLTRNSLNALYQRQVNVLGLILNCVDTEMPDYYYYRYPKYYAA